MHTDQYIHKLIDVKTSDDQ